ncbi:MAG: hypothetical protein Q9173_001149 [Seirophora scorigena]
MGQASAAFLKYNLRDNPDDGPVGSGEFSQKREDNIRCGLLLRDVSLDQASKNADGLVPPDAPVTRFSMSGVTTKECERGFSVSTNSEAMFRNFANLGELIGMLFRMPHFEVYGTGLRLTPATINSIGCESRKAAMKNAVQKAQDYAGALERNPVMIEVTNAGSLSEARTVQELGGSRGGTRRRRSTGWPFSLKMSGMNRE